MHVLYSDGGDSDVYHWICEPLMDFRFCFGDLSHL